MGIKDVPMSVVTAIEFWSDSSCEHAVFSVDANHPMLTLHWSNAILVLHVPQMSEFINVRLFWA